MVGFGEKERETIRPEFDRSIMIDFQGAKITSDTGFLLPRDIDERFGILEPSESELEDTSSWIRTNHVHAKVISMPLHRVSRTGRPAHSCRLKLRLHPRSSHP
jgi:hypothetical protein